MIKITESKESVCLANQMLRSIPHLQTCSSLALALVLKVKEIRISSLQEYTFYHSKFKTPDCGEKNLPRRANIMFLSSVDTEVQIIFIQHSLEPEMIL